jgi:hypothetical protein
VEERKVKRRRSKKVEGRRQGKQENEARGQTCRGNLQRTHWRRSREWKAGIHGVFMALSCPKSTSHLASMVHSSSSSSSSLHQTRRPDEGEEDEEAVEKPTSQFNHACHAPGLHAPPPPLALDHQQQHTSSILYYA